MRLKRVDIVIQDFSNRPIALVEVKNWLNISYKIIIEEVLPELLEHNAIASAPYLMVISQETGYLWRVINQQKLEIELLLEFSMANVIKRYAVGEVDANYRFRESQLELVVLRWLTDLVWMTEKPVEEPEKSLIVSGFLNAIRETMVLSEVQLYDSLR